MNYFQTFPKISSSIPFFLGVVATGVAVGVEKSPQPLLLVEDMPVLGWMGCENKSVFPLTGLDCLLPLFTQFWAPPDNKSSKALLALVAGLLATGEVNKLLLLKPFIFIEVLALLVLSERLPVSEVRLLMPLLKLCCWGGLYTGCCVGVAAYSDKIDFFRSGLEFCAGATPEEVGVERDPGAGDAPAGELKSSPIRLGCCFCWGMVGVGLLMLLGGARWCWPLL